MSESFCLLAFVLINVCLWYYRVLGDYHGLQQKDICFVLVGNISVLMHGSQCKSTDPAYKGGAWARQFSQGSKYRFQIILCCVMFSPLPNFTRHQCLMYSLASRNSESVDKPYGLISQSEEQWLIKSGDRGFDFTGARMFFLAWRVPLFNCCG